MSDKNKWLKRKSEVHPYQLLEKMNIQRCRGDFCDVTVVVQRMRFRAHKCVLSAASKKLHYLISNMKPCSPTLDIGHELFIQEISPQGFKILLEYIYTGSLLIPSDCLNDVSTAALFMEMEEAMQACDLTPQTDKELGHEPGDGGQSASSNKLPLLDSAFGGLLSQSDGSEEPEVAGTGSLATTQDNCNSYGSYPDQDALSEISVQNEDDNMMYQAAGAGGNEQVGGTTQRNGGVNNQSSSQYPYHHYVPPIEQTFSPRPMPKMLSTHMTILPGMLPSQAFFQDQSQGAQLNQFPVDTYYLTPQAGQFYSGNFVQDQSRSLSEYSTTEQGSQSQSYGPQSYQSSGSEAHQRVESYSGGNVVQQSQAVGGYQQQTAGYTGLDYGDNVHLYNDGNDISLVSGDRDLQPPAQSVVSGRKETVGLQLPTGQDKNGVSAKSGFREKTKASHNNNTDTASSLKATAEANKYVINISPTVQETSSNPFIEAISPYNPDVEIGGADPVMDTTIRNNHHHLTQLPLSGTSHNHASVGQGTSTGQITLSPSLSSGTSTLGAPSHINMAAGGGDSVKSEPAVAVSREMTPSAKSKESSLSSTSFSSRPAARMPPKKAGYRGIDSDYNKHFAVFSMQHSQNYESASTQAKQTEAVENSYTTGAIGQTNYKQDNIGQDTCSTVVVENTKPQQAKLASGTTNSLGHQGNHQLKESSNKGAASSIPPQHSRMTGEMGPNTIQELLQSKSHHLESHHQHHHHQGQAVQGSSSKVETANKSMVQDSPQVKSSGSEGRLHPERFTDKAGLAGMGSSLTSKAESLLDRAQNQDIVTKAGSSLMSSHPTIVQNKPASSDVVHIQTKKMAASHAAKVAANGVMASQQQQLLQTSQGHLQTVQLQGSAGAGGVGIELGGYRAMAGLGYSSGGSGGHTEARRGGVDTQNSTGGKGVGEMSTVDTAPIDTQPSNNTPHVLPSSHLPAKRPNLPLDHHQIMYHPDNHVVEGGDLKSSGGGNLTPSKNCNVVDLVDSYIEDYLRSIDQGSADHQSPVKSTHYPPPQAQVNHHHQAGGQAGPTAGSIASGEGNSYTSNQTGTLSSGGGGSYSGNQAGSLSSIAGSSYTAQGGPSFTHNPGSAYNYSGSNASGAMQGGTLPSNSIGYSVEEVSKTILNVLSQECFDDDSAEGNLQAKGAAGQPKKQESVPLTALLKMVPFHKAAGGHQMDMVDGHTHLTQYADITSSQENVEQLMRGNTTTTSGDDEDMVARFEDIESGSDDDSNYNLVIDFDKEIHEEGQGEEGGFEEGESGQDMTDHVPQKARCGSKRVPKTPTKTSSPSSKGKGDFPVKDETSGSSGVEVPNKGQVENNSTIPLVSKVAPQQRTTKKVNRRFLSPMKIPRYRLTTDYREDPEARPGHKSLHRAADEIVKPPKKRIKLKLLMTKVQDDNLTVTRKMLQKKEHKRKIKYVCQLCQREFWDRCKSFADHMQDHMQNELTFCNICGKGYKRMEDLSRHRAESHDIFSFLCLHCDQKFSNSLSYKKHSVSVHQEKKPFYCVYDGCAYRSEKFNELEKHLLVHSVDKQFACPHCSKRFSQPNGLRSHLTTCMNMQSFVCPVCSKTFNRQQGLKDHMFIHKGTKSHICNECGAGFSDPRNLGRHARTHSAEKKYACKHCDLKFKFSNCLKRHITRKHSDKETVQVGKKGGRNKKEVLVKNYNAAGDTLGGEATDSTKVETDEK